MIAPQPQHRIHDRLVSYWQQLCQGRPMPSEADVVLGDLGDIWPSCFLVSVEDNIFSYDFLGAAIVIAYGDSIGGKEITEKLVYPHPPSLVNTFKQVVHSGNPAMDESEFVNSKGVTVKYRSCVLPLADATGKISFLLGGMKWKAFVDEAQA